MRGGYRKGLLCALLLSLEFNGGLTVCLQSSDTDIYNMDTQMQRV